MSETIKIRAKVDGEYVVVKALIRHPMETGLRKDSKGKPIPAHYIEDLTATAKGKVVFSAQWGTGVATNPYISFKFKGGSGDTFTFAWKDNKGASDSIDVTVK